jgi:GT2 family glycosyltransferase
VTSGWVFSDLLSECFIILSSVIVKRECLERVGLLDEKVDRWHGYDLWLRIAFESQIGLINAPLFFRRIHESNRFYSEPLKEVRSFIMVMKKWEDKSLGVAEADRKTINRQLRAAYIRLFAYYAADGFPVEARQALKNSFARGFSIIGVACLALTILPPVAIQYIIRAKTRLDAMLHRSEGI